jgi:outer membrane protein assembly factor BamB
MNQLTSTSCARVIACALVSLLAPISGHAADWPMSGNDLANDRNQPNETLIDIGNVATLKPAWSFKTLGSVAATPLVTGGYVYVPDRGSGLHKLNARTGQVAWSRKVSEYTSWADSVSRTTPEFSSGLLRDARLRRTVDARHGLPVSAVPSSRRWSPDCAAVPDCVGGYAP